MADEFVSHVTVAVGGIDGVGKKDKFHKVSVRKVW